MPDKPHHSPASPSSLGHTSVHPRLGGLSRAHGDLAGDPVGHVCLHQALRARPAAVSSPTAEPHPDTVPPGQGFLRTQGWIWQDSNPKPQLHRCTLLSLLPAGTGAPGLRLKSVGTAGKLTSPRSERAEALNHREVKAVSPRPPASIPLRCSHHLKQEGMQPHSVLEGPGLTGASAASCSPLPAPLGAGPQLPAVPPPGAKAKGGAARREGRGPGPLSAGSRQMGPRA